VELLSVPNKSKRVTADSVTRRFDNSQANGCGKSCIDGISAIPQHIQTGLGGQRL
jgi:hypothetical protein